MTEKDFATIIKLRSFWKIDKRKGNYSLPDGSSLRNYVADLVIDQMDLDNLKIDGDGNFIRGYTDDASRTVHFIAPFENEPSCTVYEHSWRLKRFLDWLIG